MPRTHIFDKVSENLKDLPVAEVADKVVQSAKDGKVAILTAETGSGKTLLANAMLADQVEGQVVVLVPRRFLAINAAEAIADLGGLELGKEVGFAVGQQAGDKSQFSPDTKLLFATYGYALSSGLIDSASTIVCDEVHEAGVDTSLARALLHKRMQHDPKLRVLEMSATLNAEKQASFWRDIANVDLHHADGKAFPCENRYVHPRQRSVEQLAVDMIEKEGRKGIAVFRPGVGEVEETAEKIRELCQQHGLTNVEVEPIYGDMDMEERERATKAPEEGNVKVLVGTNVIESGVNIKWLDTGISDGKSKVPYYRDTGAEALVLEDLPQWRIVQQEGRVKRFTDGIFVLAADRDMEMRPQQQLPEIERISLMRLVMHAANFGINPMELKYDGDVDKKRLKTAKEELQRLDLITNEWTLTEKGEYAMTLPVGPEAGAMLYAADPAILNDAIELAAVVEVGGMRADYKVGHGMDTDSDIFDGLKAYRVLGGEATELDCEGMNVSWKRYKEVKGLVEDMHRRLDGKAEGVEQRPATQRDLQVMMLHGSVNRLFEAREPFLDLIRGTQEYQQANASVADNNDRFAIGSLREIPSKDGEGMTIVQNVTKISKDVFAEFAASREGVLTDLKVETNAKGREILQGRYFGQVPVGISVTMNPSPAMRKLYERATGKEFESPQKPQGVANSNVREVQPEQQRAMG